MAISIRIVNRTNQFHANKVTIRIYQAENTRKWTPRQISEGKDLSQRRESDRTQVYRSARCLFGITDLPLSNSKAEATDFGRRYE